MTRAKDLRKTVLSTRSRIFHGTLRHSDGDFMRKVFCANEINVGTTSLFINCRIKGICFVWYSYVWDNRFVMNNCDMLTFRRNDECFFLPGPTTWALRHWIEPRQLLSLFLSSWWSETKPRVIQMVMLEVPAQFFFES